MNNKITILGGGIGGLTLATSLHHFNIPFQLFESASSLGEVGAGIGISESTIEILDILNLGIDLKSKGNFVRDAIIVDKKGIPIRQLPIKNGGFCVHRMDLIDILQKNIPKDDIYLNHKVVSIEQINNKTLLHFDNGKVYETEYLMVADGINSLIRKTLYPDIEKRYSGQTIWRGIANLTLGEKYNNAYLEFWGSNLRFATIPLNDKKYYWYAVQVAPEGGKDDHNSVKTYLQNLFSNHTSEIRKVIEQTSKIIRNDMYDLKPHIENWYKNNIVFIGDSIHATTPNLAQGGCQAIEDAFYISLLISKYGWCKETFTSFQKNRQAKVDYIVNQSWRFGKTAHTNNTYLDFIIQTLFRLLPNKYFENQYNKLINIDYIKNEMMKNGR
jgi:2-polyprenyl-6-methoxyphenol hydroxylase-like FAD-dependent oxidoreductase